MIFPRLGGHAGFAGHARLGLLGRFKTAKMNDIDPQAYLADVLDRIHDHKINRLNELLP